MRKPNNKKFGRESKSVYSGDKILIVCEDSVTSPNYFYKIIEKLKLHSADIDICGEECGSAPSTVVDFALERKKKRKKHLKYDQVWCVIDYDKHVDLHPAINKANSHKLKIALSRPCFEYWYLLHSRFSTRPYENYDDLKKDLKEVIEDYDKYNIRFDFLYPKLEMAFINAEKVRQHHETSRDTNTNPIDDNPKTNIDELINQLKNIKLIK